MTFPSPRTRSAAAVASTAAAVAALVAALVTVPAAERADAARTPATTPVASVDRLVVLGSEGRARLVQQTLASEGALVLHALPEAAAGATARFGGPERALSAAAWAGRPGRLSLGSGSALLRYRPKPRGTAPEADADGRLTLVERVPPVGLRVEDGRLGRVSQSWLLPPELELVAHASDDGEGRWYRDGALLGIEREGGAATVVRITLRRRATEATAEDDCGATATTAFAAEPGCGRGDVDADGVPDERDVCLPDPYAVDGGAPSASAPSTATLPATAPQGRVADAAVDPFGCTADDPSAPLVLDGIVFPIGRSYLDLASRLVLDRLARALREAVDGHYEIAAHTDRAGSAARNLELSTLRAEAVRHYLLLRGVGPNRLRARGYGEGRPRRPGDDVDARRANRRVELRRIDR